MCAIEDDDALGLFTFDHDADAFTHLATHATTQQRIARSGQVAERGREAPDHESRVPAPQPRDRQLRLHPALVADHLVPFVDDDRLEA